VRKKPTIIEARRKALLARSFLDAKKALDPVILDLGEITLISDFFVICSGASTTHVRGLADFVAEEFEKLGVRCNRVEGYRTADWLLMDYGDVVIHIFSEDLRGFYSLERLWGDAPQLPGTETLDTRPRHSTREPRNA
jgi:ribosome-associated protein